MARQFQQQGHEIVDDPALADQIVVNTCAVTNDAVRDSRKLVRQLHRAGSQAAITVTGCYAQIAPSEIAVLPGVTRVIDNLGKDALVPTITGQPLTTLDATSYDLEPIARDTPQHLARTRAFVKVQDGCDNACTFCVTTIARGGGRSRALADVVREVQALHAAGYREVVLTGVHLGSYGHDFGLSDGLARLVRAILERDRDCPSAPVVAGAVGLVAGVLPPVGEPAFVPASASAAAKRLRRDAAADGAADDAGAGSASLVERGAGANRRSVHHDRLDRRLPRRDRRRVRGQRRVRRSRWISPGCTYFATASARVRRRRGCAGMSARTVEESAQRPDDRAWRRRCSSAMPNASPERRARCCGSTSPGQLRTVSSMSVILTIISA